MIDAYRITNTKAARVYDLRSAIYDWTIARSEFSYHLAALEKFNRQFGMKILEVATGPGRVLARISEQAGAGMTLYGLDLSEKMLKRTRGRLDRLGFKNYELRQGDCRNLPWPDNHFDLLYNGYMMDLLPDADMAIVLLEFRRVLKPGGQLVLLNMSKADDRVTLLEKVYEKLPVNLALYIMGNCRPVRMAEHVARAGFRHVEREYLSGRHPSEIVSALKEVV